MDGFSAIEHAIVAGSKTQSPWAPPSKTGGKPGLAHVRHDRGFLREQGVGNLDNASDMWIFTENVALGAELWEVSVPERKSAI